MDVRKLKNFVIKCLLPREVFNIYSLPNNIEKKYLLKNSKPDPMFTLFTGICRVIHTGVLKASLNDTEQDAN